MDYDKAFAHSYLHFRSCSFQLLPFQCSDPNKIVLFSSIRQGQGCCSRELFYLWLPKTIRSCFQEGFYSIAGYYRLFPNLKVSALFPTNSNNFLAAVLTNEMQNMYRGIRGKQGCQYGVSDVQLTGI